ncbi:MAG: rhodanese-like domain-containing protein [Campylobacterales bacterium]|nr:rhodanese-like domain-containing protein [Campylobacterales bacterium]
MKRTLGLLLGTLALCAQLLAFDTSKAAELHRFYSHMDQKACADSTLFMKADAVLALIREAKPYLLLDVRSEGEASVLGLSDPHSALIPIERLFTPEALKTLPTDRPIIAICHSGTRGTMAAIGLKQLGFKNVHVLKGGMIALADANTPKNAPLR